ncbi:hypothetical protein Bcop_1377 [Bacteroides coprosuis DSM 18011]|uniref:N-acetyltransferase domain-containing protein n=1 Tax=Bacteroides coprosuis DSM 18011 TaxID=679937 RepID=F3ZPB5_9BACE|nr:MULTISPECIES: N-acetyltransferase [Bacteroides]EGJ71572.1 hypothetical protein Bcop_1377 [Bacteroides coprosuis DSM 18011]
MKFIQLTADNIEQEHICCALASKNSNIGVSAKKEWLSNQFKEGLKFIKLDVHGKVFIEYLPAEQAWNPIEAPNYLFIDCLWVAGSHKGMGYAKELLQLCEKEAIASNKAGIIVMAGTKKTTYLSDKNFFISQGFHTVDRTEYGIELLAKDLKEPAPTQPQFKACCKEPIPNAKGIDIYFTAQCPFTSTYIQQIIPIIKEESTPIKIHQLKTKEEAQNHYAATTTYSVFMDGKFVTNDILTVPKLLKWIDYYKHNC